MIRNTIFILVVSFTLSQLSIACGGCSGKKASLGSGGINEAPGGNTISTTAGNPDMGSFDTGKKEAKKGGSNSFSENFFQGDTSEPGSSSEDPNWSSAIR